MPDQTISTEDEFTEAEELVNEVAETASSQDPISEKQIDSEFFSHQSRKSTKLIWNENTDIELDARYKWFSLDLDSPIFITRIMFLTEGYSNFHEITINHSFFDFPANEIKETIQDNKASFSLNCFVKRIDFRPASTLFFNAAIRKIEIFGYTKDEIERVIRQYEDVQTVRDEIVGICSNVIDDARKAQETVEKLTTRKEELDAALAEAQPAVENLRSQKSDLNEEIRSINDSISSRNVERDNLEQTISKLTSERDELNRNIATEKSTLRSLMNDISVFSTELSSYNKQSKDTVRLYFFILLIPLLIIAFVTTRLFFNAESLVLFLNEHGYGDVFKLMLSRAPYIIVSITILGICLTVTRWLLAEIININRRRQELHKVSIIASDVSDASRHGTQFSDEDAYHLKTALKMELLKEHMRENIGKDYAYAMGMMGEGNPNTEESEEPDGDAPDEDGSSDDKG